MFTLVTGDLGIVVGRWRPVCVTALQRPNSDAAAIRIVVGIAAASLSVTVLQVASVSDESEPADITSEELLRLEGSHSVMSEVDTELATDRSNGKGSPDDVPLSPVQLIDTIGGGDCVNSARSTLQSVISGVGELDLDNDPKTTSKKGPVCSPRSLEKPYQDCPFLLLDVRDKDCYDQCHIIGGTGSYERLPGFQAGLTELGSERVSYLGRCGVPEGDTVALVGLHGSVSSAWSGRQGVSDLRSRRLMESDQDQQPLLLDEAPQKLMEKEREKRSDGSGRRSSSRQGSGASAKKDPPRASVSLWV
ncbi:unnamed protein product [Ranitomeya imitator]|uniref:Rhodanese domain-containing protein n=1 Tax=Ranitomeya imitator TaxID=111125 RepID=A0ABN9LIQ4_9NEOB|nr:unnamed protein product [Ranitomeya imitator]